MRRLDARQVPSIRSFLTHIGASVSLAGLLIGCCDLTSMPSTVGALLTDELCLQRRVHSVLFGICGLMRDADSRRQPQEGARLPSCDMGCFAGV